MHLFFVVALVIWFTAHYYVGWRLIQTGSLSRPTKAVLWIFTAITSLQFPIIFRNRDTNWFSGEWFDLFQAYTYFLFGFFALLAVVVIARDIAWLSLKLWFWLIRRKRSKEQKRHQEQTRQQEQQEQVSAITGAGDALAPEDPTKRQLFSNALNLGIVVSAGTASGYGYHEAVKIPDLKYVDIPLPNLPPDLAGFTIVQLSDIHVGPTVDGEFLRRVVERVNTVEADLVVLTGDFVDGMVPDLQDQTIHLRDVKAKHGLAYCTGNHEYYWDGPGWCDEVRRLGGRVLIDEHTIIEHNNQSILLAGVADYSKKYQPLSGHDSSPLKAIQNAPPHAVSILLAHQPKSIWEASEAGFDLQLSGHTHGGQFWPLNYFVGLVHPFSSGLGRYKNTAIYVSHGTGFWGPPNRFLIPSEITVHRLVRGEQV